MYVTLNISATDIRLLSVKRSKIQKWGSAPLEAGLVSDGLILNPRAVGKAINALFNSLTLPRNRVITCLTGLSFTHRIIGLPQLKRPLFEQAMLLAAKQEIPLPLEEIYLSWQAISKTGDETDYFVSGVSRNLIIAMIQTLAEAGIEPYIMDLKPLALARAAGRANALIVDLDPCCFEIVLVADGIPSIMHTMNPKGEIEDIEDNIRRLADELSKTVKFYNSGHPENQLDDTTPLLITGEFSTNAAVEKIIRAETNYAIEPLVTSLELPSELPAHLYAANIGLALKKIPRRAEPGGETTPFKDINLNVLPGRYGTKDRQINLRNILISLTLTVIIGLLSPLYLVKNQANSETLYLRGELARAGQEIQQVQLAFEEARQMENTINEIETRLEILKRDRLYISGKESDFTGKLALVSEALPPEAHFTVIDMGADRIILNGGADNFSTVITYASFLEELGIFSDVRIAEISQGKADASGDTETENAGVSFRIIISE